MCNPISKTSNWRLFHLNQMQMIFNRKPLYSIQLGVSCHKDSQTSNFTTYSKKIFQSILLINFNNSALIFLSYSPIFNRHISAKFCYFVLKKARYCNYPFHDLIIIDLSVISIIYSNPILLNQFFSIYISSCLLF